MALTIAHNIIAITNAFVGRDVVTPTSTWYHLNVNGYHILTCGERTFEGAVAACEKFCENYAKAKAAGKKLRGFNRQIDLALSRPEGVHFYKA